MPASANVTPDRPPVLPPARRGPRVPAPLGRLLLALAVTSPAFASGPQSRPDPFESAVVARLETLVGKKPPKQYTRDDVKKIEAYVEKDARNNPKEYPVIAGWLGNVIKSTPSSSNPVIGRLIPVRVRAIDLGERYTRQERSAREAEQALAKSKFQNEFRQAFDEVVQAARVLYNAKDKQVDSDNKLIGQKRRAAEHWEKYYREHVKEVMAEADTKRAQAVQESRKLHEDAAKVAYERARSAHINQVNRPDHERMGPHAHAAAIAPHQQNEDRAKLNLEQAEETHKQASEEYENKKQGYKSQADEARKSREKADSSQGELNRLNKSRNEIKEAVKAAEQDLATKRKGLAQVMTSPEAKGRSLVYLSVRNLDIDSTVHVQIQAGGEGLGLEKIIVPSSFEVKAGRSLDLTFPSGYRLGYIAKASETQPRPIQETETGSGAVKFSMADTKDGWEYLFEPVPADRTGPSAPAAEVPAGRAGAPGRALRTRPRPGLVVLALMASAWIEPRADEADEPKLKVHQTQTDPVPNSAAPGGSFPLKKKFLFEAPGDLSVPANEDLFVKLYVEEQRKKDAQAGIQQFDEKKAEDSGRNRYLTGLKPAWEQCREQLREPTTERTVYDRARAAAEMARFSYVSFANAATDAMRDQESRRCVFFLTMGYHLLSSLEVLTAGTDPNDIDDVEVSLAFTREAIERSNLEPHLKPHLASLLQEMRSADGRHDDQLSEMAHKIKTLQDSRASSRRENRPAAPAINIEPGGPPPLYPWRAIWYRSFYR